MSHGESLTCIWSILLSRRKSYRSPLALHRVLTFNISASLYGFTRIGWRYYLVFIICPIFAVSLTIFLARETKGKSLEEIGAIFGDELVVTFTNVEKTRDDEGDIAGKDAVSSVQIEHRE